MVERLNRSILQWLCASFTYYVYLPHVQFTPQTKRLHLGLCLDDITAFLAIKCVILHTSYQK